MACWTCSPNALMLRNTCSIDWTWMSPPGDPQAIWNALSLRARAGEGVRRGRLPGATEQGCVSRNRLCMPRVEMLMPRPSIIGVSYIVSDGVADQTLPCESATQE